MSARDEYINLILEVKGRQAVADAEKSLIALDKSVGNLQQEYAQGLATEAQFTAGMTKSGKEAARLKQEIEDLGRVQVHGSIEAAKAAERAATSAARVGTSAGTAATGINKYQQNLTALSYSFNDFFGVSGSLSQRLNAIANNLPGVFAGLGGVGLALGAIVPIVAALIQNWDLLFGTAKVHGFRDAIKELEKEIKGIKEKSNITIIDLANMDIAEQRLRRLKAAQDAFNAAASASTNIQEKVAAAIRDVVIEQSGGTDDVSGAANLASLMEVSRRSRGEFLKGPENVENQGVLAAINKQIQQAKEMQEGPFATAESREQGVATEARLEARRGALETQMEAAAKKAITDTIGQALQGIEAARKKIAEEYDKNQKLFREGTGAESGVGAGFRGGLELASGENIRAAAEHTRENERVRKDEEYRKKQEEIEQKHADKEEKAYEYADNLIYDEAQKRQKAALSDITRSRDRSGRAQDLARQGMAGGLTGEDLFAHIRDEIQKELADELRSRGLSTTGEAITSAAGSIAQGGKTAAEQGAERARTKAEADKQKAERDADTAASRTATGFMPAARRRIERPAAQAIGLGSTDEQVQAEIQRQAETMLTAGGVAPAQRGAAAREIAERVMAEIDRQIAEQMTAQAQAGFAPNRRAAAMQVANGAGGGFRSVAPAPAPPPMMTPPAPSDGPPMPMPAGAEPAAPMPAPAGGGGMRSMPSSPGGFNSVPPMPDPTGAIAATQSAVGGMAGSYAAMAQRLQQLEMNAAQLNRRNQQMGPTALQFGSFP